MRIRLDLIALVLYSVASHYQAQDYSVIFTGRLLGQCSYPDQLFENKVTYSLYRSTTSYVSLTYAFDWRTGLKWRDVWKFDNPTPPLSNLPNHRWRPIMRS